jgi:hypothetical protein
VTLRTTNRGDVAAVDAAAAVTALSAPSVMALMTSRTKVWNSADISVEQQKKSKSQNCSCLNIASNMINLSTS